jgi:hypothetical protein
MRNIITKHKRLTAVVTVIGVLALAGSAFAFFTGGGSGSGTALVGTSGTVTLTATVPDGLTPGNAAAVTFTAANATTSPIQVTTVSLASITVDGSHATCATGDFSMANVTESHQVPGGATAEALPTTGSLVYANTGVSQDACKGATLTLHLTSV